MRERNARQVMFAYDFPSSYPDMACFFPTPSKGGLLMDAWTRQMLKYAMLALTLAVIATFYPV